MISDSQTTKRSSSFSDLNSRYNELYPHIFKRARCQSHPEVPDIQEIIVVKSDASYDSESKMKSNIQIETDSKHSQISIADYPLLTAYRYNNNNNEDTNLSTDDIVNNNISGFKKLKDNDIFNGEIDINEFGNDFYYNIPYPYNFDQRVIKRNCAKCCFSCIGCCDQICDGCISGCHGCHQEYCPCCCRDASNTCFSVSACCLTGIILLRNWFKDIFTKE